MIEASRYTLYRGFKKVLFPLYIYVLAKILQNGAKFIQKLTVGFKNHMKNLDKVNGLLLPKNTFLQLKTLHTENLSNITFNYLCKNSPKSLCHFLNDKSVFTTELLCIF